MLFLGAYFWGQSLRTDEGLFGEGFSAGPFFEVFLGLFFVGSESGHLLGSFLRLFLEAFISVIFRGHFSGGRIRGFFGIFCGVRIWALTRGVSGVVGFFLKTLS